MRYDIVMAPQAVEDYQRLTANDRSAVRDALEVHLRHRPEMESKSRIKRLSGGSRPQYRLRVGVLRVFYDIHGQAVEVLAIVPKPKAAQWLADWSRTQ